MKFFCILGSGKFLQFWYVYLFTFLGGFSYMAKTYTKLKFLFINDFQKSQIYFVMKEPAIGIRRTLFEWLCWLLLAQLIWAKESVLCVNYWVWASLHRFSCRQSHSNKVLWWALSLKIDFWSSLINRNFNFVYVLWQCGLWSF